MMITRREFLKLSTITALCTFFRPPPSARAEAQAQPEAQPWGFPLAFPAYFPESVLKRPGHEYYLSVIREDG